MVNRQDQPPRALRVVAALFALGAVLAVLQMLLGLSQDRLNLDLAVLGFWIAPGLLRGDRTWRRWAIALAAIQAVAIGLATPFVVGGSGTITVNLPGVHLTDAPEWVWLVASIPWGVIAAWQWWLLTRPAIRARFNPAAETAGRASEFPA